MTTTVIGVRDLSGHAGTGRAAIVVLGSPERTGRPSLASRVDIAMVPDELPARVYHEAAYLPDAEASALVTTIERTAERAARDVLAGTLKSAGNTAVLALPIDASDTHELPPTADIVASHSLMHVAETALYREALLAAADKHGLEVHRYEPATVRTELAHLAKFDQTEVDERLTDWGRVVGRPWRREHKEAALGAWLTVVVLAER